MELEDLIMIGACALLGSTPLEGIPTPLAIQRAVDTAKRVWAEVSDGGQSTQKAEKTTNTRENPGKNGLILDIG
jgi:hypothetical protein